MVRALKFAVAMLIAFSLADQLGWIRICHPNLDHIHQVLLKGVKVLLYILFP